MKKILFIAAVAAAAAACTGKNAYTVSGHTEGLDGEYIYMCDFNNPDIVIDSARVRNGKFAFKGESQTSEGVMLRSGFSSGDVRYMSIFIEPGYDVSVDFDTDTATGSPANDAMMTLRDASDELGMRYREAEDEQECEEILAEFEALMNETAEANGDNIFGVAQLMQMSHRMSAAEVIEAVEAFPDHVRNSRLATEMRRQAEAKLATEPGQPYIEVSLPGTDGRTVTLSSVISDPKNKYVLLDFWATWCGPCMGEVPYLTDAYARYHGKGFEIFGVSLDRSEDAWRKGIEDNRMNWIHVIQPREDGMEAVEAYAVESIPSNFLIETATGKIVATNLRGEAVAEKLAGLLD